jgi:hypothetical protein
MARQPKCKICLQTDKKENMVKEGSGYYHKNKCHDEYLKQMQEKELYKEFYSYITKIHNLVQVPTRFLLDIRNVRDKLKLDDLSSLKMVYDAYKQSEREIDWALKNKDFESTYGELKYCLAIVVDKLTLMTKERKRQEKMDNNHIQIDFNDTEIEYKKKESKDYSNILD